MDKKLLEMIKSINDVSNQHYVEQVRNMLNWLNLNDKSNEPVFNEARKKGLM